MSLFKRSLFTLALPALLIWGGLPAIASAGKYLVTVKSAQITPKKSKYKRWDTGFGRMPLPDPYLIMEVAGKRFKTPILNNTITPKWNVSWKLTLSGTERLYFQIHDKDLGSDDLIGKGSVLLSKANTPFGFGKVIKLTLKVERLDPPPAPRKVEPRPVVVRPRPAPRRVEPPKAYSFPLHVHVMDANKKAIADAKVHVDGKLVGATNKDGAYEGAINGKTGQKVAIKVEGKGLNNYMMMRTRLKLDASGKSPASIKVEAFLRAPAAVKAPAPRTKKTPDVRRPKPTPPSALPKRAVVKPAATQPAARKVKEAAGKTGLKPKTVKRAVPPVRKAPTSKPAKRSAPTSRPAARK